MNASKLFLFLEHVIWVILNLQASAIVCTTQMVPTGSLLGTHPQKNICQGIPRDFVFCYSWFFHSEWFQVYVNHCKSLNHDDGFWAVLNMNGKGLSWFFQCLSNHTCNTFAVSINIIWLVVSIPLKNISSLVGMMKFPLNVVKLNK
jgi:hypothetical protein